MSNVVRKKGIAAWGIMDRPASDVVCSRHFWQGFANGFAPHRNLMQRWTIQNLAEADTIMYSWNTVAKGMTEALNGVTVTTNGRDIVYHCAEPVGENFSGSNAVGPNVAGWFPTARTASSD